MNLKKHFQKQFQPNEKTLGVAKTSLWSKIATPNDMNDPLQSNLGTVQKILISN